ncbi:MAG: glycosyltransferase family 2 protein [Chloroflexota bacterium]|nr:glycosyltransferase family 2 protein [Chloroflexota bacterium]
MSLDISVVIPTYDRAPYLRRTLDALEDQDLDRARFEVIVIDDGSHDATPDALSVPRPYALRALRQENQGPGAARNAGIRCAAGAIVVFIDDDVIPPRELLGKHLRAQEEAPAAVIGTMLPPPDAGRQPVWAEWESRMLRKQYDDMLAGRWAPTPRQFYTANASVPRDALVRAGLFDPSFARAEDMELAFRLQDLGLPFRFVPDAEVVHDTPRSFDGWLRIAPLYGHYDVVMWRDKGRSQILGNVAREYRFGRHRLLRAAARIAIGRRAAMLAVRVGGSGAIRVADFVGSRRAALAACSAMFNLLYWDAVCSELGGRAAWWRALEREGQGRDQPAPAPAR